MVTRGMDRSRHVGMEQGVKRKPNPRMLKIWKSKPKRIFFWRRKRQREQWVTLKIKRPTSPACRPTTPHIISGLRPQIHSTERSLGDGHKTQLWEDPKAHLVAPLLLPPPPPPPPPRACRNAKSAEELCTLEDPTAVVLEDPQRLWSRPESAGIRNGNKSP
jgi:hypothetical protein